MERGDDWTEGVSVTKAKRLPGNSVKVTHDAVVELSLLHPTFGVKRLVDHLAKVGFHCSASTVHSILKSHGVSTRQERAARLHQRYLVKDDLTPDQRRLVRSIDPNAGWTYGHEKVPGRVLILDLIHMQHSTPLSGCALQIVVDAHDQRAFAMFSGAGDRKSVTDCLGLALGRIRALGFKVEEVVTHNGHMFSGSHAGNAFNARLSHEGIRHRYHVSSNNRRHSLIADVWKNLKQYLFQDLQKDCLKNRENPAALNQKIQDFLDINYGDGKLS